MAYDSCAVPLVGDCYESEESESSSAGLSTAPHNILIKLPMPPGRSGLVHVTVNWVVFVWVVGETVVVSSVVTWTLVSILAIFLIIALAG